MPTAHTFSVESENETLIVTPLRSVGSLAEENVRPELDAIIEEIRQRELKHAVIDLREITYFGTSMLEAMFAIWRRIRTDHNESAEGETPQAETIRGQMTLCNVSTMGREILRVSRFDTLWPICDSKDDAIRRMADES
ncbi:MAG TPA: STAS domain-containing protein [Thermoguttaceae bacterium]|nr:STAS domain-containing protein [Thermoguttaceae bacterium]